MAPGATAGHTYNGIPVLVQPHPRTVTVTKDAARAVKVLVPRNGGSLAVTGADGTMFKLTIPDGALTAPETVTLTPLTQITGAPLSIGPIEGVQIDPDGLVLARSAVLTITPKVQIAPVTQQVGFGYHAAGTDFRFELLDPVAGISLHIRHFCGYGEGGASASDIQNQSTTPPTQSYDQQAQAIEMRAQADLVKARQEAILGQEPDVNAISADEVGLQEQYYASVLAPLLILAETDPAFANDALVLTLQYEQTGQRIGTGSPHEKEIEDAWTKIREKEISRAVCAAFRGGATVDQFIGISKQSQILGMADPTDVKSALDHCLVFSLDFSADSNWDGADDVWNLHNQMHGLRLAREGFTGQKDTDLTDDGQPAGACHQLANKQRTQPLAVTKMDFVVTLTEREGSNVPRLALSGIDMHLKPGEWTGNDYDTCAQTTDIEASSLIECQESCWGGANAVRRASDGTYAFTEWTYPETGPVVAQLSVVGSIVLDGLTFASSTTKMTLTLAP